MNYNLIAVLIFVLVLVVYLTQLHPKRLRAFGLFLERIVKSWPLTKLVELWIKKVDYQIEELKEKERTNEIRQN